jgi:hypothetical protein
MLSDSIFIKYIDNKDAALLVAEEYMIKTKQSHTSTNVTESTIKNYKETLVYSPQAQKLPCR